MIAFRGERTIVDCARFGELFPWRPSLLHHGRHATERHALVALAAMCVPRCTCSPTPPSNVTSRAQPDDGYGDVTDAVYRLVEDTWLDNWSAEKYVGTIFRDSQEAALVDTAVLRVLRIMHQVGPDAPVSAYLDHQAWPEALRAARDAHVRLAVSDGEDPDTPPRTLEVLRILTRSA